MVVLPLLKPTIVTNLLLVTILNLSEFTLIYAMTQGGPGIETMTLPLYVYQEAFVFHQLGYGTAISLVLVLIGAVFSLLDRKSTRLNSSHLVISYAVFCLKKKKYNYIA